MGNFRPSKELTDLRTAHAALLTTNANLLADRARLTEELNSLGSVGLASQVHVLRNALLEAQKRCTELGREFHKINSENKVLRAEKRVLEEALAQERGRGGVRKRPSMPALSTPHMGSAMPVLREAENEPQSGRRAVPLGSTTPSKIPRSADTAKKDIPRSADKSKAKVESKGEGKENTPAKSAQLPQLRQRHSVIGRREPVQPQTVSPSTALPS